mmetsp:Transcript_49818/g.161440  ORF Transcript_49818/g.161440 Transcript_49818/m.161440 type:complete len:214 (-) Transcript_49818:969-1610(-)
MRVVDPRLPANAPFGRDGKPKLAQPVRFDERLLCPPFPRSRCHHCGVGIHHPESKLDVVVVACRVGGPALVVGVRHVGRLREHALHVAVREERRSLEHERHDAGHDRARVRRALALCCAATAVARDEPVVCVVAGVATRSADKERGARGRVVAVAAALVGRPDGDGESIMLEELVVDIVAFSVAIASREDVDNAKAAPARVHTPHEVGDLKRV